MHSSFLSKTHFGALTFNNTEPHKGLSLPVDYKSTPIFVFNFQRMYCWTLALPYAPWHTSSFVLLWAATGVKPLTVPCCKHWAKQHHLQQITCSLVLHYLSLLKKGCNHPPRWYSWATLKSNPRGLINTQAWYKNLTVISSSHLSPFLSHLPLTVL